MPDERGHEASEQQQGRAGGLDIGEALRSVTMLLDDAEQSGCDLERLTGPVISEAEWHRMLRRAQRREQCSAQLFAGEAEAFTTLRGVADEEIRAEAHAQVRAYKRRAATSHKLSRALSAQLAAARENDDAALLADVRRRLGELFEVVSSLAAEHEQIVTLAADAQIGDRSRVSARYEEAIAPLLGAFDLAKADHATTGKLHFKKRSAIEEQMNALLTDINEINRAFEAYPYVELQTRELPRE